MSRDLRQTLIQIFLQTLALADAQKLTRIALRVTGDRLRVSRPILAGSTIVAADLLTEVPLPRGRIAAITVGKAALGQARALGEALAVDRGLVIAPVDRAGNQSPETPAQTWTLLPAAHPIPDQTSLAAADAALELAAELTANDLLIVAVSGGASAMLAKPLPGLTLADKIRTTRVLLSSGADIVAINAVRKRLSAIKGGRLARASEARVLCLVLSDVHDARLDLVGSGPALPDQSTAEYAHRVVTEHDLWHRLPAAAAGQIRTARDDPWPEGRFPIGALLAAPSHLATAARTAAQDEGLDVAPAVTNLTGPVEEAAVTIANSVDELAPGSCLIWIGEPTVRLRATGGEGGRMSHLALSVSKHIKGTEGVAFLACGSDGVDGNSQAAGAVVDGKTWSTANDPEGALATYNSGAALARLDRAVVTGPTGTNLTDLMLLARARPEWLLKGREARYPGT